MNFVNIKRNFDKGVWSKSMVRMAVIKGYISKSEYELIVGKSF